MSVRIIGSAVAGCLTLALWLVSAQPASAARWTLQLAPQPPESTSSVLTGVSCTSRRACTAVGHYQPISSVGSTTVALVERWNGSSWSIQQTPSPVGSSLTGVSCTSRTACIAVGSDNGGLLAERWDGSRWSIQPVPAPKGLDPSEVPPLNAVSCVSRRFCVAVGGDSVLERWNGSRWSIQRAPKGGGELDGVSCTSARACTAVGTSFDQSKPFAVRWAGRRWRRQRIRIPNPYDYPMLVALPGVSCTSGGSCIAVGSWSLNGGDGCCDIAFAERWDGNRWSFVHARNPGPIDNWLSGVSCASTTTTCVAVGANDDLNGRNHLLTERWNGIRWSAPRIPAPVDSALDGVSCTSKTVCTAVGSYGAAALIARRT